MIAAWIGGFLLYEWLAQPLDLGFWSRLLADLHPLHSQIGASLPSFAAAFGLAYVAGALERRAREAFATA